MTGVFEPGKTFTPAATVRDGKLCVPVRLEPFDFGLLVVRQASSPWRGDAAAGPAAAVAKPLPAVPTAAATPAGVLTLSVLPAAAGRGARGSIPAAVF